jgi:beta-lactamase superfamily II metal-dependent hydrolase
MSIIKSFSVGNGDMFYIKHGCSNFTIIDCCLDDDNADAIIEEIELERKGKNITRFISTHPDEDHIHGLKYLDSILDIRNFYCVANKATKNEVTDDFKYYCAFRDNRDVYFYVHKGCSRKWMNANDENDGQNYGSSGINFLWPDLNNADYNEALKLAAQGVAFNNISPVFTYELTNGIKVIWMGDMENDFQEKIKDCVAWPQVDILFAPHHGRDSGKVPEEILRKLNPQIIVIGEAPSEYLNYYRGYNTITQNTAKDIVFDNDGVWTHVYFSERNYPYDLSFLANLNAFNNKLGFYKGSFLTYNAARTGR